MKIKPFIKYFDPGPWPVYFGVCFDGVLFAKEMNRLGIHNPPPWVTPGSDGTTHVMHKSEHNGSIYGATIIVCIKKSKGVSREQMIGLVAHESVHVWQHVNEAMNGPCPGGEHQAYGIQWIVQRVSEELWRKK